MTLIDFGLILGLTHDTLRRELVRLGLSASTISALGRGPLSGDQAIKLMQWLAPPSVRETLELREAIATLTERVDRVERCQGRPAQSGGFLGHQPGGLRVSEGRDGARRLGCGAAGRPNLEIRPDEPPPP
jgi:hypothetical protein